MTEHGSQNRNRSNIALAPLPRLGGLAYIRPMPPPPQAPARSFNFFTWLRNSFLTGIALVLPFVVTAWLIWLVVTLIDTRVEPLVPPELNFLTRFPGGGLLLAPRGKMYPLGARGERALGPREGPAPATRRVAPLPTPPTSSTADARTRTPGERG